MGDRNGHMAFLEIVGFAALWGVRGLAGRQPSPHEIVGWMVGVGTKENRESSGIIGIGTIRTWSIPQAPVPLV